MDFGTNFLTTTDWTLTNATIVGTSLTLNAGGSATQTFTEINGSNVLPSSLELYMRPSPVVILSNEFPIIYCTLDITYNDGTFNRIMNPVQNKTTGTGNMRTQIPLVGNSLYEGKIGNYDSIKITFSNIGTGPVTFANWELKLASDGNVKLDQGYYGVKITKEQGFQVEREDGKSEAIFNSDTFAMRALDEYGIMQNQLYFDPIAGKYIFNGDLTADVIEAVGAVVTLNLYAGKATIAELTVDRLETGSKVRNRLYNNTSDVNYIRIYDQYVQFITASTDGLHEVQVEDRHGTGLYWVDETHKAATDEVTDWPVMVYIYTEQIKAQIAFESVDGIYTPKIIMGVGDNVTSKSAKAEIMKGQTGLEINYYKSNTGEKQQLILGDNGIMTNIPVYTGTRNVRSIIVTDGTPDASMGQINDIIFKI